jgi:hypothetical protein
VTEAWERWLRGYKVEYVEEDEYREGEDWIGSLAGQIRRAWKSWGFVGFFIFGRQGAGKTTLALLLAKEVYGSWRRALSHLYFSPDEVERAIRAAVESVHRRRVSEARIPVIVWDDAGVWASKYLIREEGGARYAMAVQNLVELARRITASMIVTATAPSRTLTAFRTQEWYYIKVQGPFTEHGRKFSRATIYQLNFSPLGRAYVRRKGRNLSFPLGLPDRVRQAYEDRMYSYVRRAPLYFSEIFDEEKLGTREKGKSSPFNDEEP